MKIDRLVEVRAQRGDRRTSGSGYLIGPGIVLTAWHAVNAVVGETDSSIVVRIQAESHALGPSLVRANRNAVVVWPPEIPDADHDFALLKLAEAEGLPPVHPIEWAHVRGDGRLSVRTIGYPDIAIDAVTNSRDTLDRTGWINLGDTVRQQQAQKGTFAIRMALEDLPAADAVSSWPGMSGAPVFANSVLIGIVTWAGAGAHGHMLRALPVDRLFLLDDVRACFENTGQAIPRRVNLLSRQQPGSATKAEAINWSSGRFERLLAGPEPAGEMIRRDRLVDQLLAEANARPGGVTAILAPTGFGKSTLMAQLVERTGGVIAFLDSSGQRDASLAAYTLAFEAAVNGALDFPDPLIGQVDPPYTGRWKAYASASSQADKILPVVLDGIDEADNPYDIFDRLDLETDLPSNVHLFLAGRPGKWSESSLLKRKMRRRVVLEQRDQQSDLEAFSTKALSKVGTGKRRKSDFARAITSKAQGSFLYSLEKALSYRLMSWAADARYFEFDAKIGHSEAE